MISASLIKQLQELNLPEDVVAKVLLLMDDAYGEGYGEGITWAATGKAGLPTNF